MIYPRGAWVFEISRHARAKACQKMITQDMINQTLASGEMAWFGKNYVRFRRRYGRRSVTCVGERKQGNVIKVMTVGWGV